MQSASARSLSCRTSAAAAEDGPDLACQQVVAALREVDRIERRATCGKDAHQNTLGDQGDVELPGRTALNHADAVSILRWLDSLNFSARPYPREFVVYIVLHMQASRGVSDSGLRKTLFQRIADLQSA